MVNRDFWYRKSPHRYAVGQPMGAYSSWPIMALTHHSIVRFCGGKEYVILGDDIVIKGEKTALKYQEVMALLGVKISIPKSILPSPKAGITTAEVAKRLFINGNEVTPLPSKLLAQGVKHPTLFALLLNWLCQR
jgi:hypothetical protein